MKLRVATYNIHKGVMGLRRPSLTIYELRDHLHELDADLVFLQEVQGRHDKHAEIFHHWPSQAQHEFLSHEAGGSVEGLLGHASQKYFHAYGMNAVYPHGHHGNALLSRHPIEWSVNEDVSDHRLEQRGLLHCRIQTPAGPLHTLVAHFGLFNRSRQRQAVKLIEHAKTHIPDQTPVVIGGDFNDWQRRLGGMLTQQLGVDEVLPQKGLLRHLGFGSFPSRLPLLGLDRMFVKGFNIHEAKVMTGGMWGKLSDHAPFVVDLELNGKA
jgi:endonuclease/exonuclease/phosphatase family metal-dependent hydrolase